MSMRYQANDVSHLQIINDPRLTHEDFVVNGLNYDDENSYECENSHTGAEARILPYISSYNPHTSKVSISGVVVFVCPKCAMPVFKVDAHQSSLKVRVD